ncbi:MAG: hypothetical protein E7K42_02635, partial [Escherichia coli]|nr:hypothetical protein [Escherichia coli]
HTRRRLFPFLLISAEYVALSLKSIGMETAFFWYVTLMAVVAFLVSLMLHRKGKGMRL